MKIRFLIPFLLVFFPGIIYAQSFNDLQQALQAPEKVRSLSIETDNMGIKHLPAELGKLVNLEELRIACLESLEDLPKEIGNLKKLKYLILDNGNGCQMNVLIPESIGDLHNLKVLNLFGALDSRQIESEASQSQAKVLPEAIRQLVNLEELNLGRNGITSIPAQVASLHKLRKLSLDYNEIHKLPAFIGSLKNLCELSLLGNGGVELPLSLSNLKGLKIGMGNNRLSIKDQEKLKRLFPKATFSFENAYDDANANEEPSK
jgi:Leucine-rich repeat (LRR) protein